MAKGEQWVIKGSAIRGLLEVEPNTSGAGVRREGKVFVTKKDLDAKWTPGQKGKGANGLKITVTKRTVSGGETLSGGDWDV